MPELLPAGFVEPLLLELLPFVQPPLLELLPFVQPPLLELLPFVQPPLLEPPPFGEPPLLVPPPPLGEVPLPEPLPELPPLDPLLEPPPLPVPHFIAPPELAPVICGDSVHPPGSLLPHPKERAAAAATIHAPRRGDSLDHHPRVATRCKCGQPRAKTILVRMSASQAARPGHGSPCYLDVSLGQRPAELHTKAGLPTLGCVG
jgi:hypothetical protein